MTENRVNVTLSEVPTAEVLAQFYDEESTHAVTLGYMNEAGTEMLDCELIFAGTEEHCFQMRDLEMALHKGSMVVCPRGWQPTVYISPIEEKQRKQMREAMKEFENGQDTSRT